MRFKIGDRTRTHGLSRHPLYGTWRGMIGRCYNPSRPGYKYYGGAGVRVCEEWRHGPNEFIEWALKSGWSKGKRIDKDINGGNVYSPENCLIVSPKENSNNVKSNHLITYNGMTKNIQQWSEYFNIYHRTIRTRIKRGWSVEETFETPVNDKRYGAHK